MSYSIGRYKDDAPAHRDWFIGSFMEDGPAKTDAVEIKYWEMPVGPTIHQTKVSSTFECTVFISGRSRGMVDGKEYEFSGGDYIAIQPGTPSNPVIEILEPVIGFTIKAPSDPSAKKVL